MTTTMEYSLTNHFNNKRLTWLKLSNQEDVINVYNIFFNTNAFNIQDHKNNFEVVYYYAVYCTSNNDLVNAEKYYEQSILAFNYNQTNNPIYLKALHKMITTHLSNNDVRWEQYMDLYYDHVIKSNVHTTFDVDLFMDTGKYYFDKKNYGGAAKYYCAAYDFGKFDQADKIYDIFQKYSTLLYARGNCQEAEQYFLKIIDFYDDSKHKKSVLSDCYMSLANIYKSLDNIKDVIRYSTLFVDFVTGNELYETYDTDAIINLALLSGDYISEFELYERYSAKASYHGKMDINNRMTVIYNKVIKTLLENKNYDVALTCIMRIINNNPNGSSLASAHRGLAFVYLAKGDVFNYTKYTRDFVDQQIRNGNVDCKLVAELFLCDNVEKTVELINYVNQMLNGNKVVCDICGNCGDYYLEKKQYDVAERIYKLCGNDNTTGLAKIYVNQGYDHLKSNNNDLAIQSFEKAITNGGFDCANTMATLYDGKNDTDNAKKYYEMAINNGDYTCLVNLCKIYEKTQDYDTVVRYCKLAIDNRYVPAIKYLSDIYLECGNVDESFELFKKYADNF